MSETLRDIGLKTPTGYYPWYPRDFGSSGIVLQMTFTAQGIYRALLDRQWEDGGIPEDPERCRRILRCSEDEWDHFAPFFEETFPVLRGNLRVNARMEAIRLAAEKRIVDSKLHGKRGAEKRWGTKIEPENRVPYGDPIANRNIDINRKESKKEKGSSDELIDLPTAFLEPIENKEICSLERGAEPKNAPPGSHLTAPLRCAANSIADLNPHPVRTSPASPKEETSKQSGFVSTSAFQKPSVKEIEQQMNALRFASKQSENESVRFFNYYESIGWRVGNQPMRHWQSAVSGWKSKMIERGTFIEAMASVPAMPVSEFYTDEQGKLRSLMTNRVIDE